MSWRVLSLAVLVSACGNDPHNHLADAPPTAIDAKPDEVPDAAPDAPPAKVTLSVIVAGAGAGHVTSAPDGIDCTTGTCTHDYDPDTVITLTETPATGAVFAGWSGACTGTLPTCEVTLADATIATATFDVAKFPVTITKAGAGTGTVAGNGLDCGTTCTAMIDYGTMLDLTATPANLSVFAGWGGACTGTDHCMVQVTGATTISANFPLDTITLFVSKGGNGAGTITATGIACGTDCEETYAAGTMVTLTAAAATGSTFTGWSGAGCTGTGTCTVTMTTATTVTATFTLDKLTLTVAKAGNGAGTVASTPAGITCGADCTEDYDYNTAVALTATPSTGSTFTGWSGACTGTGTCSVTMSAAKSVTATFALQTFAVTATVTGNGTVMSVPTGIACPGDCTETYNYGATVVLTAAAGTGSTFAGWGGACTGTGTCMLTVTAAKNVTASFTVNNYALTVAKAGTGTGTVTGTGIACGADCTETYPFGTVVTLTAVADAGATFIGWSGACTGTAACTVTIDAAKTVTATFSLQALALTVTLAGSGSGTVTSTPAGIACSGDCSETYDYNTMVTLTQAPSTGSTFTGWSGACAGTGACVVTMDAAKSVTATFALQTFALTVTKGGNGAGTVTATGIACGADCTETYNYGTAVTLTQAPSTGSTFTGWSGACTGTGACVVTIDAAKTVTATFTLQTFAVTVTPAGNGAGSVTATGIACPGDCSETYNYGTSVALTATPATGSTFAGWAGACTGTGACMVTVDAAKSVTATFTLQTFVLSVAPGGNGAGTITATGISCPGTCSAAFNYNTMVTVTAAASTGSTFTGWGGACTGTGACVVTMSQARSVTASFTLSMFTLAVTPAGTGAGTVTGSGISCPGTCSAAFNYNTMVTLTAAAGTGSTFIGWSGACTGTSTCAVTMDQARAVTATFALKTFTLSVGQGGDGVGTITGNGLNCVNGGGTCSVIIPYNTLVAVSETPGATTSTLSTFVSWSGSGSGASCQASTNTSCSFLMVDDATVVAGFKMTPNIVFTTNRTVNGVLNGLDGADKICQASADGAGLSGKFIAYLATASITAPARIGATGATGWMRVDKKPVITTSITAFGATTLPNPPSLDEKGIDLSTTQFPFAWTGMKDSTTYFGQNCNGANLDQPDWSSMSPRTEVGAIGSTANGVVAATLHVCEGNLQHLYCFEVDRKARAQ